MANNADNIQVVRPKTDGVAFSAVAATTVPTDATTALAEAFASIGYVSENGLSMTVDREVVEIKEMGGDTALTIQNSHKVQFKFKPIEWNVAVKKEIFGAANVDTNGNVTVNGKEIAERAYVFDMRGRGSVLIRICVPRLKLSAQGEIAFNSVDPIASELTFDALPDASGNKAYIYSGTAA